MTYIFDSIIIFYVMGLFVCSNYVFDAYGRLPWKISLKNSNQMITIFHLPFYRDSETFAPRFWQPICFTGWLYLGSNFSVFPVQPLISLVFLNIFYFIFFHFSNDLWVKISEMHGWFHLLLAIGSISTKSWGSRRESPPRNFNKGQSWRSSIPRSQVICSRPSRISEIKKK